MIKLDENALICDLAETYNIYDYKEIAPSKIAIFSIGLRNDSRIKMKLDDSKIDLKTLLLASIVDNTALLLWSKTSDAKTGRNKPKSIVESLVGKDKQVSAFTSSKDYEKAKAKILSGKET